MHQEDADGKNGDHADDLQRIDRGVPHAGDDTSPPSLMWPERWRITPAVGAIVTDAGVTFSLAPASPNDHPIRVRCTSCDWDTTGPQPETVDAVRVHALRHIADPTPRISHFPAWLLPRLKGHR
ncbi:hypothetical protein Kisp02_07980 [Kineosporia sp. NBRC 101731]|nr:hypothetical protein Kisp02_07980 [Kineosporia sp. NBRC 101731]